MAHESHDLNRLIETIARLPAADRRAPHPLPVAGAVGGDGGDGGDGGEGTLAGEAADALVWRLRTGRWVVAAVVLGGDACLIAGAVDDRDVGNGGVIGADRADDAALRAAVNATMNWLRDELGGRRLAPGGETAGGLSLGPAVGADADAAVRVLLWAAQQLGRVVVAGAQGRSPWDVLGALSMGESAGEPAGRRRVEAGWRVVDDRLPGDAAQDEAAQGDAARDDAAQDEAAQDEVAQDEAAQDEAAQDEAAQDEAVQDGAARDVAVRSVDAVVLGAPLPAADAPGRWAVRLARPGVDPPRTHELLVRLAAAVPGLEAGGRPVVAAASARQVRLIAAALLGSDGAAIEVEPLGDGAAIEVEPISGR